MVNEIKGHEQSKRDATDARPWGKIRPRMFALGGILLIAASGATWLMRSALPARESIDPRIARGAPEQEVYATQKKEVIKEYGEFVYTLMPRARYRIPGLVVSLHHSDSFIDISHKFDPGNTMDLCVVWGPNITTGGYKMVTYDHGDFTCYYRWESEYDPPFSGNFLANNHMLPADQGIASTIRSLHVGDQIIIEGELVDYSVSGRDGKRYGERSTSMTREDSGNGACEIIYATAVTVVERNHPLLYLLTKILFVLGGALIFFSLWLAMYGVHRPRPLRVTETFHDPRNPFDPKNYATGKMPPENK